MQWAFFLRPILLESLQEVAIKRMTATKTKEFLSEMKVLCKVHHANLVISFLMIPSNKLYDLILESIAWHISKA